MRRDDAEWTKLNERPEAVHIRKLISILTD